MNFRLGVYPFSTWRHKALESFLSPLICLFIKEVNVGKHGYSREILGKCDYNKNILLCIAWMKNFKESMNLLVSQNK